jgi:hypothetical protein
MSESKFTPGPWWIGDNDDFDGIAILYDEERVPIANVPTGYTDRRGEANASLICAAPELLEALRKARNTLEGLGYGSIAQNICENAIRKAEGK